MSEGHKGLSDAALLAFGATQVRVQILVLLEQGTWTTAELALELKSKRQTVLHHLQTLERHGLVEEAGRTPISGGPLISYRGTRTGWAAAVAAMNKAATPEG